MNMFFKVMILIGLSVLLVSPVLSDEGEANNPVNIKANAEKNTKLTEQKAVKIAREFVKDKRKNLAEFTKSSAMFFDEDNTWLVSFAMDPTPPGGYISVVVDDKTGKVKHWEPGK